MDSKYEFELWSRSGLLLADISRFAKSRRFSMQRNEAEDLSFTISLENLESLASSIGQDPRVLFEPYQSEIKVKRNGEYLFGTQVGQLSVTLDENIAVIEVRAFGYFNLLIDRFVTKDYTSTDAVDIAWDLIDETQSQTNGDMGITLGGLQTITVNRDRTYVRQNVKEAIVNLTELIDGNFDFEFTYDKQFNTYDMIGSTNVGVEFVYPRNIKKLVVPRDGKSLFNKIYGLGSGFGEEVLSYTPGDNASQLAYGVHERVETFNSVVEQATLEQNTDAFLSLHKDILEIPQMTVNGEDFDLNSFGIGDRIIVSVEGHSFLSNIDNTYRVERIEVGVDENDAEDITVFFDDHTLGGE